MKGRIVFLILICIILSSLMFSSFTVSASQSLRGNVDTNIIYTLIATSESAAKHTAHVRLVMNQLTRSSLTLSFDRQGSLLGGPYPITIKNLYATNEEGEKLQIAQYFEDGWSRWTISTPNAKTLTVEYDVVMDYYWKAIDAYIGYLAESFGMSMGLWTFLVPSGFSKSPVLANFSLPTGWGVYAPWDKREDLWYVPSLEYFVTSTFALGKFQVLTRRIGNTNVSIAVYDKWARSMQEDIADASFRIFDYYASVVFTKSPIDKYMAIYAPTTDDGKEVGQCEWSQSQGISLAREFHVGHMVEYAHRVFHIWNIFPPTGMQASQRAEDWTWWAAEGIAIYYNTRVLVDLAYLKGNEQLRNDFNRYLREFLGTKYDAPVAEAFKLWDASADAYFFVTYRKGALVSFIMDALTRKMTNEDKTLDDLMRRLYDRYGGMNGSYSNRDIIRVLNSMTGFDFKPFFDKYVYGKEKLPLKTVPGDLAIDWTELLRALKLFEIPIMTLGLSDSLPKVGQTVNLTAMLINIDGEPIVNQPITFYLNSTLIGSASTDESGLATLTFRVETNPGTYRIVAYYGGSPLFLQCKEATKLTVTAISTSLILVLPSILPVGKSVIVNATLKDEFGSLIEDATLEFYVNVDGVWSRIGSAQTNTRGLASIEYMFDRAGVFQLRTTYSGAAKYGGSEALATITVVPLEGAPPTAAIPYDPTSLVAMGVFVVVVAVLLAKRRFRKTRLEAA